MKREIKVGQLWRDNDRRMEGRILRVTGIQFDSVAHKPLKAICGVGATARYTRISIKRLNSAAFTMVRNEDGERV